jgi:hypothetical protein
LLSAAAAVAFSAAGAGESDTLSSASVLVAPAMPQPGYLQTTNDPLLGTTITRVTDPGSQMAADMTCRPLYCRHRYSSTQAWNADQSLLVIANGCYGLCFLDGQTYKPAFRRPIGNDDCKWHPSDPALMICVGATQVYTWEPRSNAKAIVFAPDQYSKLEFGPWKGNPSRDGSRIALRATSATGSLVAFAYDLSERKKYPDIQLANLPGRSRSCGITPSGRFIACFQTTEEGVENAFFFTVEGKQVNHWAEHHRPDHGDMTIDADGSDVYVGISKSDPDKWHVIKRRIEDGAVTVLAPYGYASHASLRNASRGSWVFLSYEGEYGKVAGKPGRAPFYQEIVAVKIDGSGEIRRIAQTRNIHHDYHSETQASPSPDGSQVIWSSNWGKRGAPVADYVSRVQW